MHTHNIYSNNFVAGYKYALVKYFKLVGIMMLYWSKKLYLYKVAYETFK